MWTFNTVRPFCKIIVSMLMKYIYIYFDSDTVWIKYSAYILYQLNILLHGGEFVLLQGSIVL